VANGIEIQVRGSWLEVVEFGDGEDDSPVSVALERQNESLLDSTGLGILKAIDWSCTYFIIDSAFEGGSQDNGTNLDYSVCYRSERKI
jgi:hypothetical protein